MRENFLLPKDDGLQTRTASDHTKNKLEALKRYIEMFLIATKNMRWRAWNYIDLQSGPGKVKIRRPHEIILGSPLIALNAPRPFTNYWFVDLDSENIKALKRRTDQSERINKVITICGDCNAVVDDIVKSINETDRVYREGIWPSLNLAFLDPEGLELEWSTVEKLASVNRMDLIINVSTSGFERNVEKMINSSDTSLLEAFFGTNNWRGVYDQVRNEDGDHKRRAMLDFYKRALRKYGYKFIFDDLVPDELVFKNSRGRHLYTLVGASKSERGRDLWQKAISNIRGQRRLF